MDFKQAVCKYNQNPTKDVLTEVTHQLVTQLTLNEKIKMMTGQAVLPAIKGMLRYAWPYNRFPFPAGGINRLGIPAVAFTDGPRGVVMGRSTCFPASMLRGACFDVDLEYRVGAAIAKESIALGANYFAGICINLLRNPKWGRAQESYGEDTYLLGEMGKALTLAVQDYGMIACPKHYALNSIEDLRFRIDVKCDERTLREVYLPHFKKCVDAGALSMMGSYNKVNGTYACESKVLLKDILRDEWGFDGFTISDFIWGVYNAERAINAGLNIEMPLKIKYRKIKKFLKDGSLQMEAIDDSIFCIISTLIRTVPKIKPLPRTVVRSKEHLALAQEVAEKGIVLLKNTDNLLPILDNKSKIAVIGRYADKMNTGDLGSSKVDCPNVVTAYQGIKSQFVNATCYNGLQIDKALSIANNTDYVIVCVGSDRKDEGECIFNVSNAKLKPKGFGGDRDSVKIRDDEQLLINSLAKAGHKVIVNIIGGSAYVISDWSDNVSAILNSFYSGVNGGYALANILSGQVNPSGKLPFTIARNENDYPEFKHVGCDTLDITYDYYHGYTLFEKSNKPIHYPFGFGLSYTDFSMTNMSIKKKAETLQISIDVTNIGNMRGDEVVQVYVQSNNTSIDRPLKVLKGFKKVSLDINETQTVEVTVLIDDIKFYDENTKLWALDSDYTLYAGNDSQTAMNNSLKISL